MPFGRKNKKSSTNNRTAQKNMERLEVITNPKKRENNQIFTFFLLKIIFNFPPFISIQYGVTCRI